MIWDDLILNAFVDQSKIIGLREAMKVKNLKRITAMARWDRQMLRLVGAGKCFG